MGKFKVGDKVLITKGTDKGNCGIILDVSENGYFMKNDNFNSYGMSKYFYVKKDENVLQLLERREPVMSKFKVGDNVVITSRRNNGAKGIITKIANDDPDGYDNSYYVDIYEGAHGEFVCEHDLRLAERSERDIFVESLYNYQNDSHDDYLTEMASIAYYKGLNIAYNDEDRLGVAYFKVYDHDKIRSAEKVARLHFKDSGMEYHKDPLGKQPWILNSSDIKKIKNLLKGANKTNPDYTNWQTLCFQWNYDNKLIPMKATIKDYFAGNYDNQHFNDSRLESAYVPSTQEMPDTWIYDPSKGKK